MFLSVLSGLIVSVDAFFIGLSLGLQKNCKFMYLVVINAFLFVLCLLGFFLAGQVYEAIPFDPDIVVGFAFIGLGVWTILQFKLRKKTDEEGTVSGKTIVLVGLVMSGEAMLITMGITFIFLPYSTLAIPVTVALAHFGYSALSFFLARTKHVKRIPPFLNYAISGSALIIYGLLALFVEFGI
ncbi:MAG: manganese efflux pump [Defluviitaleaceae bacterium]|nr:manganese efflux pump [Defluviitaleaceae bacterium]